MEVGVEGKNSFAEDVLTARPSLTDKEVNTFTNLSVAHNATYPRGMNGGVASTILVGE